MGNAKGLLRKRLAPLLAQSENIEAVYLNSCCSSIEAWRFRTKNTAVVAMEGEIRSHDAIELAVEFYKAVAAGAPFKQAFHIAKSAVELVDLLDGTSVFSLGLRITFTICGIAHFAYFLDIFSYLATSFSVIQKSAMTICPPPFELQCTAPSLQTVSLLTFRSVVERRIKALHDSGDLHNLQMQSQ